MVRSWIWGLWTLCAVLLSGAAMAQDRVALVIGNADYQHATRLANPLNDAQAMAQTLEGLGFDVHHHEDLTGEGLRRALGQFTNAALRAEIALVFYAGHGIEMDGRNFIIPTDARMETQATAQFEAISLDQVLSAVRQAGVLGMVLLDACRDNPFNATMIRTHGTRAVTRGFAPISLAQENGILVSFAAQAGQVAEDGAGQHSPYTAALLNVLRQPGLEIGQVFRKVRAEVIAATNGAQVPIERMQLPDRDIYLLPASDTAPAPLPAPQTAPQPAPQPAPQEDPFLVYLDAIQSDDNAPLEDFIRRWPDDPRVADAKRILEDRADQAFWERTETDGSVDALRTYILVFPEGRFADEAKARLAALATAAPQPLPAPRPAPDPVRPAAQPPRATCAPEDGTWSVVNIRQNDTLFVRSGPSTSFAEIGELPWNAQGVRVQSCNADNWCRVTLGCISGYSFGRYLSDGQIAHDPGAFFGLFSVTDHPSDQLLNVRSGPGTQYQIVGEMPHNAREVVVSDCQIEENYRFRWCKVLWNGVSGWAYGRYLRDAQGRKPERGSASGGGTCLDLWHARNALVERRGYCFQSAKGQAYFSNANCFTSSPALSPSEAAVADRIKALEARRGC